MRQSGAEKAALGIHNGLIRCGGKGRGNWGSWGNLEGEVEENFLKSEIPPCRGPQWPQVRYMTSEGANGPTVHSLVRVF